MNLSLDRDRAPTTIVMAISIILLLSSIVAVFLPKGSSDSAKATFQTASAKATTAAKSAKADGEAAQEVVAKQTWAGISGQVSSIVTLVNAVAAKHNVKIVALRPQHAADTGDLTQIPYAINAEGAYTDMLAFERDLEKPENRLAVELFQVGASDESSDHVTCTINVMAYVADDSIAVSVPTASAGTGASSSAPKTKKSAPKTVAPKKR
ncbi:MAG TPA: type 4a pilus biogenesis protein PilO [Fimbriimonas sp.]|nr:type 4a pilus biogenesis protein PilO [Fimbriimonas sp.]